MFEATLTEASILKRVLDAIKDLVTEANFDCNTEGISLQAMDTSRVALVSFFLQAESFEEYRCDRPLSLGINLNSLTKIMKCANSDDKGEFQSKFFNDFHNKNHKSLTIKKSCFLCVC